MSILIFKSLLNKHYSKHKFIYFWLFIFLQRHKRCFSLLINMFCATLKNLLSGSIYFQKLWNLLLNLLIYYRTLIHDREFIMTCFLVFTGRQLLIVKTYNQYVKIKLLEVISTKENNYIWKIGKKNRIFFV